MAGDAWAGTTGRPASTDTLGSSPSAFSSGHFSIPMKISKLAQAGHCRVHYPPPYLASSCDTGPQEAHKVLDHSRPPPSHLESGRLDAYRRLLGLPEQHPTEKWVRWHCHSEARSP